MDNTNSNEHIPDKGPDKGQEKLDKAVNYLKSDGRKSMDISTFEYLKPTDEQLKQMEEARQRAFVYANALEALLPDGPDKTYLLRKFREVAMWVNVAITRYADGAPRK